MGAWSYIKDRVKTTERASSGGGECGKSRSGRATGWRPWCCNMMDWHLSQSKLEVIPEEVEARREEQISGIV